MNPEIADIELKYLRGDTLNEKEKELCIRALSSNDLSEKIIAVEALLKSECSEDYKQQVILVLSELCSKSSLSYGNLTYNILLSLSIVPLNVLARSNAMRQFIFDAAKSTDASYRSNAVLPLGRLAKYGDIEAKKTLENLSVDVSEIVKQNAKYFIEQIN